MADEAHPTYPNPSVAEAVCELHFRRSSDKPWKPSLPGELFKVVQDDYPEMEPVLELGVQFELGPSGLGQRVLPARQRLRLRHREHHILMQIAENVLTVNILPPYPGWMSVKRNVLSTWKRSRPVLEPEVITRIGLRYINRIPRLGAETAGKWLKSTDLVPARVLSSSPGFLSRVEARMSSSDRIVVTLGDEPGDGSAGSGAVIFDIDRIAERELPPEQTTLETELDRLHDEVWEAFAEAMTEDLEDLLSRTQA